MTIRLLKDDPLSASYGFDRSGVTNDYAELYNLLAKDRPQELDLNPSRRKI
jgi:hypothetical protein